MTVRRALHVVVDGSFCVGKTTLVAGLVAALKARSINAGSLPEVARGNPFIEESVVHRAHPLDLIAELHLFCEKLAAEVALCRHHDVIISDASVLNVLAHVDVLLPVAETARPLDIVSAMNHLAAAHARAHYDEVLYLSDVYPIGRTSDPFRTASPADRDALHRSLRSKYERAGINFSEVPKGLPHDDKVRWCLDRVLDRVSVEDSSPG